MLSDDDRKRIELDAATRVRAQWGHVNPRALGEVIADIKVRMQEGTWGQQSLPEQVVEIARLAHAQDIFTRDEATADYNERAANGPERCD